jgi:hypothetical protein
MPDNNNNSQNFIRHFANLIFKEDAYQEKEQFIQEVTETTERLKNTIKKKNEKEDEN